MKKIFIGFALVRLFFSFTQAQHFWLEAEATHLVEFSHELNPLERNTVLINGTEYQNVGLSQQVLTAEQGEPAVPFLSEAVRILHKGKASDEMQHEGYLATEDIQITPPKGDLKRNVIPDTVPYTFGEIY